MRIEVATPPNTSTKDKGDLLEQISSEFLRMQNYEVSTEIRVTASELDLLCKHRVNQRVIYVECKAHRDTLSANVLTNLLGTITLKGYQEGWLVSTGTLGKDAKGFQCEWENKPTEESQKLSIYTPDRIIEALINTQVIKAPPHDLAIDTIKNEDLLGDWMLLITPYGRHWIITCLSGGVPEGVLVFSAKTGQLIEEQKLLRNIADTDTSQNTLDFEYIFRLRKTVSNIDESGSLKAVVEVQHGDSWADYRPARPKDFVGRQKAQTQLIHFLEDVQRKNTSTRVFAITGDSGMGKSSLIAKLRDRVRNQRYRRKFFVYAVDVRAATNASYMFSSLLSCLRNASRHGFGKNNTDELKICNTSEPFESRSIVDFLDALEAKKQVVCLIFDQFEELYSKTELFSVFEVAQRLFLSATSAQSNLVLGFAWKSDSTVQQNHRAYFMWHSLSDHRFEIELRRFRHAEASEAITLFEKELGQKLLSSLRRQLIENSQGYPWLLKKLSIHIYEQIQSGVSQSELMDKALDVESLFKRDLQKLTQAENTCLNLIAKSTPADWFNVLEASGQDILHALLDKRLVIRSGDRLNLYWDIFREYVLTKTVPSIPLTYFPGYPSLKTLLMVAQQLDSEVSKSYQELSDLTNIQEKTIGNVIRDLIMFGVATGSHSQARLDESMDSSSCEDVLRKLRRVLKHHALTISLSKFEKGTSITETAIIDLLKEINPVAQHQERTWKAYADRMGQWLFATGYIVRSRDDWSINDQGDINLEFTKTSGGHSISDSIFVGDTSPAKTVEGLNWLISNTSKSWKEIEIAGFRNAAIVLRSLRIIIIVNGKYTTTEHEGRKFFTPVEIVWNAALKDIVLQKVTEYLRKNPLVKGTAVGEFVRNEYQRKWSVASVKRVGNSLRQWAQWLLIGTHKNTIPEPLGRKKAKVKELIQLSLFEI